VNTPASVDYRDGFVTSGDGIRLHFRDYGDRRSNATPVLCLSGLTRNCKDFHALALKLAPDRRVICLDYRGRGQSDYDPDWHNYHPATYVGDVLHLLTALNLHRVFVVGTSLGGIVAMALGAARPTSLAGALLNDVGPDISLDGLAIIRRYMEADKNFSDWKSVAQHLADFFPDLGFQTPDEWETLAKLSYRRMDDGKIVPEWDTNLVRPLQNISPGVIDLWPLYRSLGKIPLVVLRGALSNILLASTFKQMTDVNPNMTAVTVPDVGHAPSLSEPLSIDALNGALANADTA
jgi:pimeloyl-ACP methyl ester carboxylesterase